MTITNPIINIKNDLDLENALNSQSKLALLYFWTQWHEPCQILTKVIEILAEEHKNILFLQINADKNEKIISKYEINSIPTFIFLDLKNKKILEKIEIETNPQNIKKTLEKYKRILYQENEFLVENNKEINKNNSKNDLEKRLNVFVKAFPVLLFMKGTPESPKCGFSQKLVQLLKNKNITFQHFDVLSDETLRQTLKTFSNWKTFPQLYIEGKFIGGLDIVEELIQNNEFDSLIPKNSTSESLNERLKALIHKHKIMLFMKGSPENPQCGFSRKMVDLLNEQKKFKDFGYFDILKDQNVRQGLKVYSNWKTYPQLYVNGKLIGGLDIVKEMIEEGELDSVLDG